MSTVVAKRNDGHIADGEASRLVVLLAPRSQENNVVAILENTRSEVVSLPVVVTVRNIDLLPPNRDDRESLARNVLAETGAAVVFWFDEQDGERVSFVYSKKDGVGVLERRLEGSGKDGIADAIGLIAGGTVRFLMRQGTFDRPAQADETAAEKSSPPAKRAAPSTASADNHYRSIGVIGSIGGVGQLAARDPDFTFGGRFSLALSLARIWRFSVGAELVTPVESTDPSQGISFERLRFPFHLGVGVMLPLGRWRLGGGLSAIFSSSRHTPKSANERIAVDDTSYRFIFTMEVLGRAEYPFNELLGLYLALGFEAFFEKVVYRIEAGPKLFEEYLVVQPKFVLGLTLALW